MNLTSNQRGRQVHPSGLHPSPGFHRRDIEPRLLCRIVDEARPDPEFVPFADCEFVLTTPDVRARVKLDLVWAPNPESLAASPQFATPEYYWAAGPALHLFRGIGLWLTKRTDPCLFSGIVNAENLVGDIWTPQAIPDPGCLAYHVEIDTCAEELWGRLHVAGPGQGAPILPPGTWFVRAAAHGYESMSDDEWNRLTGRFALRVQRSATVNVFAP